eukprot:Gb_01001 [translate_table: standard]
MLCKTSPDSTSLLWPQVKGHVLLLLVCFPQCSFLVLRDHSQNLGY